MSEPRLKVLNLGAGVQSTTLALMCAAGEFEQPHVAIFADTGWEPASVYAHLDRLEPMLPFKVLRVSNGNLRERLLELPNETVENKRRFPAVPFFTRGGGMGRRQCTKEYKLMPIRHAIKELLGVGPGRRMRLKATDSPVQCWIGISTDEAVRMKPSDVEWIENRWPLVELNMSRHDCLSWLSRYGIEPLPPKSSCLGCPYHDNGYWQRLRKASPAEFDETVKVDAAIRNGGTVGMREEQFIHRSLVPLDQVDFGDDVGQLDLFDDECEGMCGV